MKHSVLTLQGLYDSEINFSVSTFWDGGFDWKLGDALNGFKEEGCDDTFDEACMSLFVAAIKHWPDSDFARKASSEIERNIRRNIEDAASALVRKSGAIIGQRLV